MSDIEELMISILEELDAEMIENSESEEYQKAMDNAMGIIGQKFTDYINNKEGWKV